MKSRFHLDEEILTALGGNRDDAFRTLMASDIGESISRDKGGQEVRRLTLGSRRYYLKRRGKEPLARLAGMLLAGSPPLTGPLREKRMALLLHAAGFAAMEPVAWGETLRRGFPVAGFLLVREIPGDSLAELYDRSTPAERRRLLHEMGELVGRLHARGFLHVVRLKDLIKSGPRLVLIDRETSKPRPRRWFTPAACVKSLARAARRTFRDGHRITPAGASSFLRGYHAGLASKWSIPLPVLVARTLRAVRAELSP